MALVRGSSLRLASLLLFLDGDPAGFLRQAEVGGAEELAAGA
jgi:hypothetical protein